MAELGYARIAIHLIVFYMDIIKTLSQFFILRVLDVSFFMCHWYFELKILYINYCEFFKFW
jgi:hypothetical protein